MESVLGIGFLWLLVNAALILAVLDNDTPAQDNTTSLADHEIADLANPP